MPMILASLLEKTTGTTFCSRSPGKNVPPREVTDGRISTTRPSCWPVSGFTTSPPTPSHVAPARSACAWPSAQAASKSSPWFSAAPWHPSPWGLVIGIPVVIAAGHAIASQLYGVNSYDPLILGLAIVVLAISAALAAVVPARRAASIDPMRALRTE
jgi:hypothetical protein